MITQDLFESVDLARGVDNVKALLRAVARSQDAEIMLNNEPVTVTYPEARFMAGKFRAFQRAGRATEFYRDMADPMAFDDHMRQLRALIDKQKQFRSTAKSVEPMAEKKRHDVGESLRAGEYHLATVTLDDGTTHQVKVPFDEGFREAITKQFARQGRTVTDIDMDWSVRSDLSEKKDACYNKVKSRYKVWPSAYASGALVQCRKKGAANWGNKSK